MCRSDCRVLGFALYICSASLAEGNKKQRMQRSGVGRETTRDTMGWGRTGRETRSEGGPTRPRRFVRSRRESSCGRRHPAKMPWQHAEPGPCLQLDGAGRRQRARYPSTCDVEAPVILECPFTGTCGWVLRLRRGAKTPPWRPPWPDSAVALSPLRPCRTAARRRPEY